MSAGRSERPLRDWRGCGKIQQFQVVRTKFQVTEFQVARTKFQARSRKSRVANRRSRGPATCDSRLLTGDLELWTWNFSHARISIRSRESASASCSRVIARLPRVSI